MNRQLHLAILLKNEPTLISRLLGGYLFFETLCRDFTMK